MPGERVLIAVLRDGPIIRTDYGDNRDLLEGLRALLSVVVAEPALGEDVRLKGAALLTSVMEALQ